MTKKVNFGMISIKDINGNNVTIDTTKELGNLMYMQGEDLAECELGQAIYHSNDEGPKDAPTPGKSPLFEGDGPAVATAAVVNTRNQGLLIHRLLYLVNDLRLGRRCVGLPGGYICGQFAAAMGTDAIFYWCGDVTIAI